MYVETFLTTKKGNGSGPNSSNSVIKQNKKGVYATLTQTLSIKSFLFERELQMDNATKRL